MRFELEELIIRFEMKSLLCEKKNKVRGVSFDMCSTID